MFKVVNICNYDGIKIILFLREGVSMLYIGYRCKVCLLN